MFCQKCGKEIPDQSTFCNHCGNKSTDNAEKSQKKSRSSVLPWVLVLILATAVVALWLTSGTVKKSEPETAAMSQATKVREQVFIPKEDSLISGTINIPAGKIHEARILISEKMRNPRIVGHFSASGGSGNDVQVVLTDEDNFVNWKNGHQGRALYNTDKITQDSINARIPGPGIYYLAFSNSFSTFTEKQVTADIKLKYEILQ